LIRLLLDQGVPRDVATLLRSNGYDRTHVGEIGMALALDVEILARALDDHAVLVTFDADFHTILAVTSAIAPSVIRLRLEGLGANAVMKIVHGVVGQFENELMRGSMITVKARKTTCHKLPIGTTGN
jgi:predicted nuclease of predicted toxin-antitoxin system